MCPKTLAEAVEKILVGASWEVALGDFVDTFALAQPAEARYATIAQEPPLTNDKRLDAWVGAIGEYLAKQHRLGAVPAWVAGSRRCLDLPWHTSSVLIDWKREVVSDGMREYLTFSSPAEFVSHNIFTEERPLRRARGPQSAKA